MRIRYVQPFVCVHSTAFKVGSDLSQQLVRHKIDNSIKWRDSNDPAYMQLGLRNRCKTKHSELYRVRVRRRPDNLVWNYGIEFDRESSQPEGLVKASTA